MATNDISDVVKQDGVDYFPRKSGLLVPEHALYDLTNNSIPARSPLGGGVLYALACLLTLSLALPSKAQAAPIPSEQGSKNSTLLSRWYDLKFGVGAEREEAFKALGLTLSHSPQNSAGVAEGDTQTNIGLDFRLVGDVPNPKPTGFWNTSIAFLAPEHGSIDANLGGKEKKGVRIKLTGGYEIPYLLLEPNLAVATGASNGNYSEKNNLGYGLRLKTQTLELPGGKYVFFVDANSETAKYTADGLVGELKGDVSGKDSGFGMVHVPSWLPTWLNISSIELAYRNTSKSYGGDLTGTNRDDVSSLDAALIWTPESEWMGGKWLVAPRISYEDLTLRADDSRVKHSQKFREWKGGLTLSYQVLPTGLITVSFAQGEELEASLGFVWTPGAGKK